MNPVKKIDATTSTSTSTSTSTTASLAATIPSVTSAEVDAFVQAIDTFSVLLGAEFVVPQPEEARRMIKPRRAAPTIVPMVADISKRYGVVSTAYPTSATLAKQQIVNTLSPVVERIGAVQKLVNAIISVGQSSAWEGSMVTYGLLKSEARGNAVLRNALAPVREKLRPTYETEAGTKTVMRSRAKKGAKVATAAAAPSATSAAPSGEGTKSEAPAAQASASAPVASPAAPATAPTTAQTSA